MITVRPYRENDIYGMKQERVDRLANSRQTLEFWASNGKAYAFVDKEEVVAVLGGTPICQGAWHIWAIMTEEVRSDGLYLTKVAKAILDVWSDLNDVHRYQATIDVDVQENIRWIQLLGFKYESTMVMASPYKTDVLMYAMFPNGGDHVRRWRKSSIKKRVQRDVRKLFGMDV